MRKTVERINIEEKYPFLSDLNEEQFLGATTLNGPVLILAGAGSGKTKTIISRTAYIIARGKCEPEEILVMTFTNKAAKEMKSRGEKILKENDFWEGVMPLFTTFHSWGAKFLRSEYVSTENLANVGLNDNFTIIDSAEQKMIFNKLKHRIFPKAIADEIKHTALILPISAIQNKLIPYDSSSVASGMIWDAYEAGELDLSGITSLDIDRKFVDGFAELYIAYKEELRKNNAVDFDDLINLPIKIISSSENLKNVFSNKYKYIMADEFQDTNNAQLELMKLLIYKEENNICVVGDDSQSIYGWRGAEIKYILKFHEMFPNTKMINLKINYRSHQNIVDRANVLLSKAEEKHEFKEKLIANSSMPGIVKARFFKETKKEAEFVVNTIRTLHSTKSVKYGEMAVLYRAAALNRQVELELIRNKVPYKIHRGKTLLEKKISLDILSYLKFLYNRDNQLVLSNLLVSAKILSEKRLAEFTNLAEDMGESLFDFLKTGGYENIPRLSKSIKEKIYYFIEEVEKFDIMLKEVDYGVFVQEFFQNNIITYNNEEIQEKNLQKRGSVSEKSVKDSLNNLNIIDIIRELAMSFSSLSEFLELIALDGEEEEKEDEKVNLMTIHASKGLEFDVVFVIGMTSKIFPSIRVGTNIEEERRLAYVAMTRARKYLSLSGAVGYYGPDREARPSLFIEEAKIPVIMQK